MVMEFVAPMVLGLGSFAMIAYIVYVIVDGRRRRERLKVVTEFHSKLLDKIGSAQDFGEFLDREGGKRFLDTLSVERGSGGPRERLLRSTQTGVVLLVLGLGLLILGRSYAVDEGVFTVFGVIIGALGVGFLLSTVVSYRLAGTLGLFEREGGVRPPPLP